MELGKIECRPKAGKRSRVGSEVGVFAEYQPRYAEHGIATFPVLDKRPAVKGYLKMGLPASRALAEKFTAADGLGFACGERSGVTVVDIDSADERLLADTLLDFGPTPFIVRSGSGNHQAWYRHSGERRKIRPDKSRPVDILGGGYVVAPPSRSPRGVYTIIQGALDDLANLPCLKDPGFNQNQIQPGVERVEEGARNQTLWRSCMGRAPRYADFADLLEFAREANRENCRPPLNEMEVFKVATSAWERERDGENFFGGRKGLVILHDQLDSVLGVGGPDALCLLAVLKRHHWARDFVCANAMATTMPLNGWTIKRFSAARRSLEELGEIVRVRGWSRHAPAVYRFKTGLK